MQLLAAYKRGLLRHEVNPELFSSLDLDNHFFWLFRLTELIAKAHAKFDEINARVFAGKYPRPRIQYCTRATGGYYQRPTRDRYFARDDSRMWRVRIHGD